LRVVGSSSCSNNSNAELGDAALLAEVGPSFSCPPIAWQSITVCDIIAPFASSLKGGMTPAATRALQLHSYLQPRQEISRQFSSMSAFCYVQYTFCIFSRPICHV
jgi:hypothetical protein